jgi:hypothetical protein
MNVNFQQENEDGRFCRSIMGHRNFANKNVVLFDLLGWKAHGIRAYLQITEIC